MKKKLGVIGGMGPEATAYFYEEVIRHTKADCDQEHLDMTILSHASMPDRTKAIQSGECDPLLQAMEGDLKVMEAAGAEHIAIPCNTSHYFYDQIQAMTEIPIIHMPRETVRYAKEHFENVRRIGLWEPTAPCPQGFTAENVSPMALRRSYRPNSGKGM